MFLSNLHYCLLILLFLPCQLVSQVKVLNCLVLEYDPDPRKIPDLTISLTDYGKFITNTDGTFRVPVSQNENKIYIQIEDSDKYILKEPSNGEFYVPPLKEGSESELEIQRIVVEKRQKNQLLDQYAFVEANVNSMRNGISENSNILHALSAKIDSLDAAKGEKHQERIDSLNTVLSNIGSEYEQIQDTLEQLLVFINKDQKQAEIINQISSDVNTFLDRTKNLLQTLTQKRLKQAFLSESVRQYLQGTVEKYNESRDQISRVYQSRVTAVDLFWDKDYANELEEDVYRAALRDIGDTLVPLSKLVFDKIDDVSAQRKPRVLLQKKAIRNALTIVDEVAPHIDKLEYATEDLIEDLSREN